MFRARSAVLLALVPLAMASFALACDNAPTPDPTATATAMATATATAQPSSTASPAATNPIGTASPTPTPLTIEVQSQVWLVDAASGESRVLLAQDLFVYQADFDDEGEHVRVRSAGDSDGLLFTLDGSPVSDVPDEPRCVVDGDDAVVDGRRVEGAACGAISPDGAWMIYGVPAGEHVQVTGYPPPVSDYWLADLAAGETRLLQAGLIHCGGCDGRFGVGWSASGRFVTFAEFVGGGRVFLADLAAGTSSVLREGNDITEEPRWSPSVDVVAFPDRNGGTRLLDPVSGAAATLPIDWPAAWDASGRLLYSPAWGGRRTTATGTKVVTPSGRVVAELAGAPSWIALWDERTPLLGTGGEDFVAALEGGAGCDGVQVHVSGEDPYCVPDGEGALVSPDGSMVAIPIVRERDLRVSYGAGEYGGVGYFRYDVAIYDVASGSLEVVVSDVVSGDPPGLHWSPDSAHLVVYSPAGYGI